MAKTKDLVGQIAQGATKDQVTVTVTSGSKKLLLRLDGKLNVKGDYAYLSLPSVEGLYKTAANGELYKSLPSADAESLFFPERAAELAKKAEEVAQLKELAKKLGFKVVTDGDSDTPMPFRTRAPRGSKPKRIPKTAPAKGDKFTSVKDGSAWTVSNNADGMIKLVKDSNKEVYDVKYSGIFWRWWNKA